MSDTENDAAESNHEEHACQISHLRNHGLHTTEEQRDQARTLIQTQLQKYEDRDLTSKDFRILQGVMSKDFKSMEQAAAEQN